MNECKPLVVGPSEYDEEQPGASGGGGDGESVWSRVTRRRPLTRLACLVRVRGLCRRVYRGSALSGLAGWFTRAQLAGRGLHSFTLEPNLSNSRTPS